MNQKRIVIGTRGSELARAQTELVKAAFSRVSPLHSIEVKVIKTEGDRNLSPIPLDVVGKGWFTKEIEKELSNGGIDCAVHSLKDLAETSPRGLILAGFLAREDARDVLVSRSGSKMADLKAGSVVGTDSSRRRSQVLHARSDLKVESVRGNVPTRLGKLDAGSYDALILAAAGLSRLNLLDRATEFFPCETFVPAPGQGALVIQARENDASMRRLCSLVTDSETALCVSAERVFSSAVGGGCKTPVGAYATVNREKMTIHGFLGDPEGRWALYDSLKCRGSDGVECARELAAKMLSQKSEKAI